MCIYACTVAFLAQDDFIALWPVRSCSDSQLMEREASCVPGTIPNPGQRAPTGPREARRRNRLEGRCRRRYGLGAQRGHRGRGRRRVEQVGRDAGGGGEASPPLKGVGGGHWADAVAGHQNTGACGARRTACASAPGRGDAATRLCVDTSRPSFSCSVEEANRGALQARRWWRARGAPAAGQSFHLFVHRCVGLLEQCAGPLGESYRRLVFGPRRRLPRGVSSRQVFPLPPVGRPKPAKDSGASRSLAATELANVMVAILNMLYDGGSSSDPVNFPPSAAQRRVLVRQQALAQSFLDSAVVKTRDELDAFLQHSCAYGAAGVVDALDDRAGVPTEAATVPVADLLEASAPEVATQIREPSKVLLRSRYRPPKLGRAYRNLGASYGRFLKRGVRAGMFKMRLLRGIAKHQGRLIVAGGFAVPKAGSVETRAISPMGINDLLDERRMIRPVFGYIPRLRATSSRAGTVLRVSKVDARHYYFRLRLGRKWLKYTAHPGARVRDSDNDELPCMTCFPMGFGPSAGWSQSFTNFVTDQADLPAESRVVGALPVPDTLPVWGSILDDIWAVEEDDPSRLRDPASLTGPTWTQRCAAVWERSGVQENLEKRVVAAEGAEVQGYFVHPTQHWVGVSLSKRVLMFQGVLSVIMVHRPLVREVDRIVGKLGFAQSARAPCRSILEATYEWLNFWCGRTVRAPLSGKVFWELFVAAFGLVWCQFHLDAPWSHRVEATDSSLTGLGRSWTRMPEEVVREVARRTDCKGVYTNLAWDHSLELTEEGQCPLKRVVVPFDKYFWQHAGCPWAPKHITLGECDASIWSALDRLTRPSDDGCRYVQPVDSAALAGALNKGRSPSRQFNHRIRRHSAVVLAGGLEGFYPWVESAKNPADIPSRWWEPWWRRSAVKPQPGARSASNASALAGALPVRSR